MEYLTKIENFAKKFDVLVFIQPTSPMIKSEYINQGIDKLISEELDSVFSVTKEHWLPRWNEKVEPIDWSIDNLSLIHI